MIGFWGCDNWHDLNLGINHHHLSIRKTLGKTEREEEKILMRVSHVTIGKTW